MKLARHALIACLFLAACRNGAAPAPAPASSTGLDQPAFARFGYDIEPHIYDVPPGRARELRRALDAMHYPTSVVTEQGAQTQYVSPQVNFTSDSHVVVTAPPQFHDAITEIIKQLASETDAAAASTFEITYWIVEAAPAAAAAAVPPELGELEATLGGLALGARTYKLLDRASARTNDGERGELAGKLTEIAQTLSTAPGGAIDLELELKLHTPGGTQDSVVSTTLSLGLDKPAVIADTLAAGDGAALILYVVRARAIP